MKQVSTDSDVVFSGKLIDNQIIKSMRFNGNFQKDVLLAAKLVSLTHNVQPWNAYWEDKQLHFMLDQYEFFADTDINGRATLVSLGAATLNAEIVAGVHQLSCMFKYLPDTDQPGLVAKLITSKRKEIDSSLSQLFPCIWNKDNNPPSEKRRKVPKRIISKLEGITRKHPVSIRIIDRKEQLETYAGISIVSDQFFHLCKHFQKELPVQYKDASFEPPLSDDDEIYDWLKKSSALVILSMKGCSSLDYLLGGRAVQRFWLLSKYYGLGVLPLAPIFLYANNVSETRALMQDQYVSELQSLKTRLNVLFSMPTGEYPLQVFRLTMGS